MVVDTESAFRHQTLSHFIHTFIRNYDRESAADCTMRSKYVPNNIKIQLLRAVRECGNNERDSIRLSGIANMGLFIHTSCNEIMYYHSILSSMFQFTAANYVKNPRAMSIIKIVLDDIGRIEDEDIQFMLEKYRFIESEKMAGRYDNASGFDKIVTYLKPVKIGPERSYLMYYTRTMLLKVVRSVVRNSKMFFDRNAFGIGPTDLGESATSPKAPAEENGVAVDAEGRRLYEVYKEHRERMTTIDETVSFEKLQHALKRGTVNDRGVPMKEPPEDVHTAFDQPPDDDSDEDFKQNGICAGSRHPSSPCYSDRPFTREDQEVESILRSAGQYEYESPTRSVEITEADGESTSACILRSSYVSPALAEDRSVNKAVLPYTPKNERIDYMDDFLADCYTNDVVKHSTAGLDESERDCKTDLKINSKSFISHDDATDPSKKNSCLYASLATEKTTRQVTLDGRVQSLLQQQTQQEQRGLLTSDGNSTTATLEKTVVKLLHTSGHGVAIAPDRSMLFTGARSGCHRGKLVPMPPDPRKSTVKKCGRANSNSVEGQPSNRAISWTTEIA